MRLFKGFILALLGLFTVITLFSLLMPSRVITIRSAGIAQTQEKIYDQINNLKNWKNWHPVFKSGNVTVSEQPAGPGAFARWTTNGKENTLKITESSPQSVRFLVSRPGRKDVENTINLSSYKNELTIQAEWVAMSHLKWYPWEKFSGMFLDKMTGPGYEAALNELKSFMEAD